MQCSDRTRIAPGAHLDILGGALTEVTGLVEKPKVAEAPSNLIISGRYILQPEVMRTLEGQEKGAGGEIQLTDAMARMIGNQPFHAVTFKGRRFDCGSKVGFVEATIALALERDDMAEEMRAIVRRLTEIGDEGSPSPPRLLHEPETAYQTQRPAKTSASG